MVWWHINLAGPGGEALHLGPNRVTDPEGVLEEQFVFVVVNVDLDEAAVRLRFADAIAKTLALAKTMSSW